MFITNRRTQKTFYKRTFCYFTTTFRRELYTRNALSLTSNVLLVALSCCPLAVENDCRSIVSKRSLKISLRMGHNSRADCTDGHMRPSNNKLSTGKHLTCAQHLSEHKEWWGTWSRSHRRSVIAIHQRSFHLRALLANNKNCRSTTRQMRIELQVE